jgi:hypothetical protein
MHLFIFLNQVNCTSTLTDLNTVLEQISITVADAGNYTLVVYVDDLGDGATTAAERATSHLNATGYVFLIGTLSPLYSCDLLLSLLLLFS